MYDEDYQQRTIYTSSAADHHTLNYCMDPLPLYRVRQKIKVRSDRTRRDAAPHRVAPRHILSELYLTPTTFANISDTP